MSVSTATAATVVTSEQIARCQRTVDENTHTPFYLVESERDSLIQYRVEAIRKNGQWYFTCTCPAGLNGFKNCKAGVCKHVRWAKAAAAEYKELIKAEAEAQARIDAEKARRTAYQIEREALYKELNIEYTDVDNETLKRIIESNKKPARIVRRTGYQARPFSLLK